ncbi:MAG: hypothetical protein ACI9D4_002100 [Polaribacter sp.]|jgi:hypothetical protein
MKRRTIELVICFLVGTLSYGQAPNWSVNENNFEYSMTLVAFVNIEGDNLSSTSDMVGAFSNGELRGGTKLTYVSNKDRYYAYLTIFSNTDTETINFQVYNSVTDKIVDINKTINFEVSAHYGDLVQAYSFANPSLNSGVEIVNFEFKNVFTNNRTTSENNMTLYADNGQNLESLNAVFELSTGARLLKGGAVVVSGNNALDFSSPIAFQVISEDESNLEEWTITVSYNADIGDVTLYKKNAVCYKGGAIKVASTVSGSEVTLFKDLTAYAAQNIVNGETIFTNLESGNYTVKISSFEKAIIINLKE